MNNKQRTNQVLAIITLFLIIGGIVLAFPLDELWRGLAMFIVGLVIILLKAMWANAVWADNTLHRWTAKNLAPEDDVDITFTIEEEKKDE